MTLGTLQEGESQNRISRYPGVLEKISNVVSEC